MSKDRKRSGKVLRTPSIGSFKESNGEEIGAYLLDVNAGQDFESHMQVSV